jgi:hypothetical protein
VPRTPDSRSGPLLEEEIQLEERSTDPTGAGHMRYVNGSYRFRDATGVYDPRSGGSLPSATELGQVLVSLDGSTFEIASPLVSDLGGMLTNGDGHMVVQG